MASYCRGCLSRLRLSSPLGAVSSLTTTGTTTAGTQTGAFHTSTARYANPLKKKSNSIEVSRFRQAKSAKLKKKGPVVERSRPPPPGERKALRKRIVLSNPNALEVEGMPDLSPTTMVDGRLRGTVVGLPVPMLEQLRAVQAFKPKQGWSIFRRPGTVMRKESLELARLVEGISGDGAAGDKDKGRVVKRVVTGVRGAGKSVHLLQAMAMAFLKNWVVFTIPETQDLVNAHTGYAPLDESKSPLYVQNEATAELLSRTVTANSKVLKSFKVSQPHPALKSAVKPGMTLDALATLGIQDPAMAWTVFQALWTELTATGPAAGFDKDFKARPPILVTIDGLAHWMKNSEYRSADFEPIHAHDLVFVKHFLSLLQPGGRDGAASSALPNGGILLYATSTSNAPAVYALDVALQQLQARKSGLKPSSAEFPQPDVYKKPDTRVIAAFDARPGKSPKEEPVRLQTLEGLSRDETRGFMEYFARSGLLRESVNDEMVGEKWSLSAGGVIGELEKLGKRLRVVA